MARPTSLTPMVQKRIVTALRDGCTRRAAAAAGGVSFQTFLNWFARGQAEAEGEFFEFFESVEGAENEAEKRMTDTIRKAALGHKRTRTKKIVFPDGKVLEETVTSTVFDWKAAMEWLKRRRRLDWGDDPPEEEDDEGDIAPEDVIGSDELEVETAIRRSEEERLHG